jgi:transcriptional regulator with XRE-family HTH domain
MIDGPGSLGALLRQRRAAAGLSQQELGQRAGLSRRGISDLERGVRRSPFPATVRRLIEALQLDASEGSALRAAARAAQIPAAIRFDDGQFEHKVPLSLTSFIGRAHELAEIQRLLGVTRLLTLCGPGGIGKTRLALQAVQAAGGDSGADVVLVDLSLLADASLVAQTIARSFAVSEQPDRPIVRTLITALRQRKALLVLDNCEHVLVHAQRWWRNCFGHART